MAISFPINPQINDVFTVGSKSWSWNGYAWDLVVANTSTLTLNIQSAFEAANNANMDAESAFFVANNASKAWNSANNAYTNANTGVLYAQSAFNKANSAGNDAVNAYLQANTAINNSLGAFNKANSAGNDAVNAFIRANTAINNALGAFNLANNANLDADSAFNKANSAGNDAVNAYIKANTVTNYLPLSGGTLTGRVEQSSSGFGLSTKDIINTRTDSGFWQTSNANISRGWPETTSSWYHLLTSTHNNDSNYYSMQFAGNFYNSNSIYYRATNGDGNTTWHKIWHSGNDGSGSSLDADFLDGQQGSYYTGLSDTSTLYAQSAFNKANSAGNDAVNAFTRANTAINNALGAFNLANNANLDADSAFNKANSAGNDAVNAFIRANTAINNALGAFNLANTALTTSNYTSYAAQGVGSVGTSDLNTITISGMYRFEIPSANGPGVNYGQMLVMHGAGDTITQIVGDYSSGSLYTRSGNPPNVSGGGSWSSWRRVLDAVNYTSYVIPSSGGTFSGPVIISTSSSSDALRITQTGSGNALVVEDNSNPDSTPFVITNEGQVVIGTTAKNAKIYDPQTTTQRDPYVQIHGLNSVMASQAVVGWSPNSGAYYAPALYLARSASGTINTQAAVSSGMPLGSLMFSGDDGTSFVGAALIQAYVDGTPGTNDMPGMMLFSTTRDGASSPTEAFRINSLQNVLFGRSYGGNSRISLGGGTSGIASGTSASGIDNDTTVSSAQTNAYTHNSSYLSTQAASFNLSNLTHNKAAFFTLGAGSTITNQYGFYADGSLTSANNNYGFYSAIPSGSGRYNFYAAGTADNYFAGNTGIGTTSPSTWGKFAVVGTNSGGTVVAAIVNTSGTINTQSVLSLDTTNNGFNVRDSQIRATNNGSNQTTLEFYTANAGTPTEKVRINHLGNVGIGTASPQTRLHVSGSDSGMAYSTFENTSSSSFGYGIILKSNYNNSNTISRIVFDYYGSEFTNSHGMNYVSGRTNFSNHYFRDSSNTVQMMISNLGNVGIGTFSNATPPSYKLDVAGTANTGALTVNGTQVINYPGNQLHFFYGGTSNTVIHRHDGNDYYILLSDAGTSASGTWNSLRPFSISKNGRVYIDSTGVGTSIGGNLGIGTTSPAYKLDVAGTANTGALTASSLTIQDSTNNYSFTRSLDIKNGSSWIGFQANSSGGSYNNITNNGDAALWFSNGNQNAPGNLVIAPWSNSSFGIRLISSSNTVAVTGSVTATATISGTSLISTVATGTAPFSVSSTTLVTNLNADLLDGISSGSFLRSDATQTYSGGVLKINTPAGFSGNNTGEVNTLQCYQATVGTDAFMTFHIAGDYAAHFGLDGITNDLFFGGWSAGANKYRIWHSGNDGLGSGLDADLLDGQSGTYYTGLSNTAINNALGAFNKANSAGNDAVNAYIKANTVTNYLPLSGGTLTGRVVQSSSGFVPANKDIIYTRIDSGFWQTSNANINNGWPETTSSWYHLLTSTHSNDGNYYSMQFAGNFYNSNSIYYRSTNGDGNTTWNKIWHSGNDGLGSGLDADLLDGQSGAYYTGLSNTATLYSQSAFNKANSAGNDAVNAFIRANTAINNALGAFNLANTALTTSNYNSYTPTLTGTGASGSWNINSTSSRSVGGWDGTTYRTPNFTMATSGGRTVDLTPNTYNYGLTTEFKSSSTFSSTGNYSGLITYAPWDSTTASTGDPSYQLLFSPSAANSTTNPVLKLRAGIDTTWGSWNTILHSGNYSNYIVSTFNKANSAGNDAVNAYTRANNSLLSNISQQGGKSYVTHDFNTYPNLYDVTFVNPTGSSNLPTGMTNVLSYRFIMGAGDVTSRGFDLVGAAEGSGNLYIRERSIGTWNKLWHSNNDGLGSGLDADLLDGQSGAYYTGLSNTAINNALGAFNKANSGPTLTDDTSTNANRPLVFTSNTNGQAFNSVFINSTELYTNPSTGTLYATIFSSLSDESQKDNISPLQNSSEIVNKMNPVSFNWKKTGKKSYGVIAQEIEKILPDIVHENDGIKSVEYDSLIAFLIKSIQELSEDLNETKSRLLELEKNNINN